MTQGTIYTFLVMNNLHIGDIICKRMKAEGRTKKWLAEQVCRDPSCLCKMLKKGTIDTDLLSDISFALDYDFALYLTAHFNKNRQKNRQIMP